MALERLVERSLARHWGLDTAEGNRSLEELERALALQLRKLLEEDPQRLVNVMYQLDVDEGQFRQALSLPDLNQQSEALAQIVLRRELKRQEWRAKYERGEL